MDRDETRVRTVMVRAARVPVAVLFSKRVNQQTFFFRAMSLCKRGCFNTASCNGKMIQANAWLLFYALHLHFRRGICNATHDFFLHNLVRRNHFRTCLINPAIPLTAVASKSSFTVFCSCARAICTGKIWRFTTGILFVVSLTN